MRRPWILMNQAGETPGGSTPAAPPATPPVPTPAAVTPPAEPPSPEWLPGRLARAAEQEREKVLAELGVTDPAKAKKLLADAAKAEEEAKSTGEKLGETTKELKSTKARLDQLEAVTKERATSELTKLTDAQRAAVTAVAGDDPATQLRTITALAPTWTSAPPVATTPVVTPPPATTMAPPTAPPSTTTSPPDRKAEYAALKAKNPIAAAAYLNAHANEIYPPA